MNTAELERDVAATCQNRPPLIHFWAHNQRKWGSCSTTKTLTPRAHPGGGPKEAEWPLEYPEVPRERA